MPGATVWDLPDEVLVHILSFLPAEDIARAASACSRWEQVAEHRRVWHGKSYLYLSGGVGGLPEALLVVRALPVLKRVSIHSGLDFNIYLSGESAEIQVPNLQDEVVKSAISSLVTENLSIDFPLLEDTPSNCLRVQVHQLKQLDIHSCPTDIQATEAKLRALAGALSNLPLPHLQSAQLHIGECFLDDKLQVYISGILVALLTCPALDQLSIQACCSLFWDMLAKFSKLQTLKLEHCKIQFSESLARGVSAQLNKLWVLELQNCKVDDIRFLDWCPQLRNLSIIDCRPLRSRELFCKSELRSLHLRHLDVGLEFLNVLCPACPQLRSVVIDSCRETGQNLALALADFIRVKALPPKIRHLRLKSNVTSNQLAEVVQCLPHLEILDITQCNIMSLHFLRHCSGLTELSLVTTYLESDSDFHELGQLKNLQKLSLNYREDHFEPVSEVLRKLPQLRALEVKFRCCSTLVDLSFLRHCRQLHSLSLKCIGFIECQGLHELTKQKDLRKFQMDHVFCSIDDLQGVLPSMSHLEELHVGLMGTGDFSFLSHCPELTSLSISFLDAYEYEYHFAQLCSLKQLRRLVLDSLPDYYLLFLLEQVRKMPQLEYFGQKRNGVNFLETWEGRGLLSSLRSRS